MSTDSIDPIAAASAFHDVMGDTSGILQPGPHIHVAPDDVDTLWDLSFECERVGDFKSAQHYMDKAVLALPQDADIRNRAGELNFEVGQIKAAAEHFEAGLAADPEHPGLLCNMGLVRKRLRDFNGAYELFEKALIKEPDHLPSRLNLDDLFGNVVPAWHFPMMNDQVRNDAFEAAICGAVTPQSVVLEIGTGSGLLAMMAARAGAKHVYTVEMEPLIAEIAKDIIAKNGYADRITVITKNSQDLVVGSDLPQLADLLITETVDNGFLGENTVACVEHARRELLKPDAQIIPQGGRLVGCLMESRKLWETGRVGQVSGFDLGDFNKFKPTIFTKTINDFPHRALSEDFTIFTFDFCGEIILPERKEMTIPVTQYGTCHLLSYWFQLDLDGENGISTRFDRETCWQQSVQPFDSPLKVKVGDTVGVIAKHNRTCMSLRTT